MKQARDIDPDINLKDVSQWKAELEPRKTQVAGYNSFIANAPYQEFQMDLFFISKKKRLEREKTKRKRKKKKVVGGGEGGGGGV